MGQPYPALPHKLGDKPSQSNHERKCEQERERAVQCLQPLDQFVNSIDDPSKCS